MDKDEKKMLLDLGHEIRKIFLKKDLYDAEEIIRRMNGILLNVFPPEDESVARKGTTFVIYADLRGDKKETNRKIMLCVARLFLTLGFMINEKEFMQTPEEKKFTVDTISMEDLQREEVLANTIMMPENTFREKLREWQKDNVVNIKELSDYFHMPPHSVKQRCSDFGISFRNPF